MSIDSILSNSTNTSTTTANSSSGTSTSTSSFYSTAYASLTSSTESTSSLTAVTSSSDDQTSAEEAALQALNDQIQDLIDGVTSDTGETSVSFRDIMKYRDQLQKDFEETMDKALSKLGLDMSTEFTLTWDADKDKVTVNSSDGSIDVIANYFKDEESMREAFSKVLSYNELLASYEDDLDYEALRSRVLPDNLAQWLAAQRETSDQLGQSGSMLFGEGDDSASYIKLDVTV